MQRYQSICQYLRQTSPTLVMLSEVWAHSLKQQFTDDLKDIYPYSWIPKRLSCKLGPEFVFLSKFGFIICLAGSLKS